MQTIAIGSHKGGCGKTATTRALGEVLAGDGLRVLMVDLDAQASLTSSCGIYEPEHTIADVLGGVEPGKVPMVKIIRKINNCLDLAPSSLALAGSEAAIYARTRREYILRRALTHLDGYDVCLIDCPPSLAILTINALVAADSVLIPAQPLPMDLAAVRQFLDTVQFVIDEELNPELSVFGILLTFADMRLTAHQAALRNMQAAGWSVLPVAIGRSVRIGESAGMGKSITTYEPNNPTSAAYQELGKLVHQWLKTN